MMEDALQQKLAKLAVRREALGPAQVEIKPVASTEEAVTITEEEITAHPQQGCGKGKGDKGNPQGGGHH